MFFKRKNKNLDAIYIMHSLQGLALSLIGIFIPIYLLILGYFIKDVLVFYIIHYLSLLFFAFMALVVAKRIGLVQTIILRYPFVLLYFILLYFLESTNIPIFIIAILGGLNSAFYWMPLHILFASNTQSKTLGDSTGKLFALPQVASIASPLVGGLVAVSFGFKALIGIVFVILIISVLPILNAQPIKISFSFKIKNGIKLFRKYPKYFLAEVFDNIGRETEAIIWPIFVYLSLAQIESVGLIGTLLALSSAIFTMLVGKISDKYQKRKIIKLGAILLFAVWVIRFLAKSEVAFYLITILAGFFTVVLLVFFAALIYKISQKNKIDDFL